MPRHLTTAITLLVLFSLVALSGCSKPPEDQLVKHVENMNEIMEDNMDSPKDGLEELRSYMQDNLPEMMEAIGDAMVELDKIEDADERAERAKEMAKKMESASQDMALTGLKFFGAMSEDEEAMKYAEEWMGSWENVSEAMESFSNMGGMM